MTPVCHPCLVLDIIYSWDRHTADIIYSWEQDLEKALKMYMTKQMCVFVFSEKTGFWQFHPQ